MKESNDIESEEEPATGAWKNFHSRIQVVIAKLLPQINLDLSQLNTNLLKCKKYLECLEMYISSENALQKALKEIKAVSSNLQHFDLHEDKGTEAPTDEEKFKNCKNIDDLTKNFPEFEYTEDRNALKCILCKQQFNYGISVDMNDNYPQKFRFLKRNLKRHLQRKSHQEQLQTRESEDIIHRKEDSRNKRVGSILSKLAYFNFVHKRPDTDYPDQVYMLSSFGLDIGELNHSTLFTRRLLPHIGSSVENRVKKYLSSPLLSTGYKPPIKVIADKVTWKHQTRQLIGVVTAVPGAEQPLQALFLGVPVVSEGHAGQDIALNVSKTVDEFISPEQYKGISCDGQYFILGVHKHLDEHYGAVGQAHHDHDAMHRAGLVDTHLRNPTRKGFTEKWLNELIETICQAFELFNWGKEYEHLVAVVKELARENPEIKFKNPCFFSATRFPNYSARVFDSFLKDFSSIIRCFEESQADMNNKHRMKYATLSNKIQNLTFMCSLSGITDIYSVFSQLVECLQKVCMLPHVRYDTAMRKIEKFEVMLEQIDVQNCTCLNDNNNENDKCLWVNYHRDMRTVMSSNPHFRHVPVGLLSPEELNTRMGSQTNSETRNLDREKTVQISNKRLSNILIYLKEHLKAEVFDSQDKITIEHSRTILNLGNLHQKCLNSGYSHVANLSFLNFHSSSREFHIPELTTLEEGEIRAQFRIFLRTLEKETFEDYSDIEIFSQILKSESYSDCPVILHILICAALSKSVESVVESWGSEMEEISSKKRQISEIKLHDEMMICLNGPGIVHCDSVVSEGLQNMVSNYKSPQDRMEGHFIRKSENIESYIVSKVVDGMKSQKIKLPFML